MIRSDGFDELGSILSDEVLDTLVPTATFGQLPGLLAERFGTLGQGIVVTPPADRADDAAFAEVIAAIRAG